MVQKGGQYWIRLNFYPRVHILGSWPLFEQWMLRLQFVSNAVH